jgi:hypothetical protein
MSRRILTPRLLSAHLRKTPPSWKRQYKGQVETATEAAAILASDNTPPEVRKFLARAMRAWAECLAVDVSSPELARDAFLLMNHLTPVREPAATKEECRAGRARLAIFHLIQAVRTADREGKPLSVPAIAREELISAGFKEEEGHQTTVIHGITVEASGLAPAGRKIVYKLIKGDDEFYVGMVYLTMECSITLINEQGETHHLERDEILVLGPVVDDEDAPAEMPEVIAPHIPKNEPTDLNLWRQSHPLTIKRCIVDVKGGA